MLTLLDNHQVQNRQVGGDNATPDRLPAALAVSAAVPTEAAVARLHEQANTAWDQHTLLHGKALLVLTTHDLEDVAIELLCVSNVFNAPRSNRKDCCKLSRLPNRIGNLTYLAQGFTIDLLSQTLVVEGTPKWEASKLASR